MISEFRTRVPFVVGRGPEPLRYAMESIEERESTISLVVVVAKINIQCLKIAILEGEVDEDGLVSRD